MYGNVYEADHKLQVTYGFFFSPGGGVNARSQSMPGSSLLLDDLREGKVNE